MNGKEKKILIGMGIAFGALAAVLGGMSVFDKSTLPPDEDYGEWVVTRAPTCEERGVETRALLSSPEVTQVREIPSLGHSWGDWEERLAPTCIAEGSNVRVCAICRNEDYAPLPAFGHDWGEWETTKEATCLSAGYDTRVCKHNSSHVDLRVNQATGHDWSEWATLTAPTCTQTGIEGRACRNDNRHSERRTLAALGHDWNEPVVTEAPTCTSQGTLTTICRNDNLHTETESIPAIGHSWGEWVVTTAPTYFEEGEETRVCANDSAHTETRSVPILMNAELYYVLNSDKESYSVQLNNRDEAIGTVEIPATYQGLPVTDIMPSAFSNAPQITRVVVLGDNLQKIGSGAFSGCSMLEEVVFSGNSLREIGGSAFNRCVGLKSFAIPEGVERIGSYLFSSCENLKNLSLPASLTSLIYSPWGIVTRCLALETITVAEGNSVYRSENDCLIERTTNTLILGTKNSVIPAGITSIALKAFQYSGIESVRIPESVVRIEDSAFAYCTALLEVEFEGGNIIEIGSEAFRDCTGIMQFVLPESVTAIGNRAFFGWTEEQTIIIKGFASLEEADAAWGSAWREGCNAMGYFGEQEFMPEGVITIGAGAFRGCALSRIVIPTTVESVGRAAFYGWTKEQTIIVRGYASEEEADAAWDSAWREGCNATILYEKQDSEQVSEL